MPIHKNKDDKKTTTIPQKIIESISSLTPTVLMHSESCPPYFLESFDIQEKLDENLQKRKKVKEQEYKIGNYLIKKTLGQGTFGKVKLGIYLPTQEKVAIKILEKDRIEKDDEIRVKREFDMLALFNHPNIILVAEIFESSDSYYSVMEYCDGGELFNYIVKNRRLSEEEAAFFYYQLINGLEYIHSLGIVHRDLKPENLLLTNEHLLKIIDFGLSNYFKEGQKDLLSTPCGSPCYASPEMVGGNKYNGFKIDIWSSGIILYAMLCGYLPFEDKDNDALFEKILECKLIFPKYITNIAKDLMEKILVTDPNKRINIPEIKKHPFYLKGKDLFEQEFSVYQITKDVNEKTSFIENIDINNIFNNPPPIETKKDKDKDKERKEYIEIDIGKPNENKSKEEKEKEKEKEKKEKVKKKEEKGNEKEKEKEINIEEKKDEERRIKEIEIANLGIEVIEIKKDSKKESDEKNDKNEKEKNFNDNLINKYTDINKEISTFEFKEKERKEDLNNIREKEKENSEKENIDTNRKENKDDNKAIIEEIDIMKQNKSNEKKNINGKSKINDNIYKNINTTSKKNDIIKTNQKLVTLIKDKDNYNIRRKLIKNNNKVNIRERTKPRAFKSNKKPSKIIKNNNFKRRLIHRKKEEIITPNLNNIRYNSKEIIRKRVSFSKGIRKRYSSKGRIKKQNLYDKINSYSNNINNTIDDVDLPNKLKMHFNFNKINISYVNNPKKSLSIARHNMKLSSFELSKLKKDTKKFEILYRNNTTSNEKIKGNYSNNKNQNRNYNLFHRDYLKQIKISSNKNNNKYLENEYKKNFLKTETGKEKDKNILEMKGIKKKKLPNIKIDLINNANIKIIDNTKDEENKNTEKTIYNYNAKTNIKIANNNKIFKKAKEPNSSGNSENIIKVFDKDKNYFFKKQNLNKYNKISKNQNMNYIKKYEHKNTLGPEDKNLRIKFDILTNLGGTQKNTNNSNINKDKNNSKKKINKNENKNKNKTAIIKDNDIPKNDNLNINIDLNNNKKSFITDKNRILKDIENTLKTEIGKKPSISYKNNLNDNEKGSKNKLSHKKIVPINPVNPIKINNYRKNQKNIKRQNIPKMLNKTSNSSNFNSFIKNPFIPTESTTYNTINQSINNSIIPRGTSNKKINNNSKNSQKILKNNKKKPCVTIRNTVINFNMIDTGLILESLNKKKKNKKRIATIDQNNSVSRLHNNHLFRLCNKFNNNLMHNINNSNIHGDISIKTKTINVNSNNNFNFKKIKYGEKVIKSITKNKIYTHDHDKFHMKFNSMKLEDINGFKKKKKNIIKIKTNTNIINNKFINVEKNHFNTISNEGIASREKRRNYLNKNK